MDSIRDEVEARRIAAGLRWRAAKYLIELENPDLTDQQRWEKTQLRWRAITQAAGIERELRGIG